MSVIVEKVEFLIYEQLLKWFYLVKQIYIP